MQMNRLWQIQKYLLADYATEPKGKQTNAAQTLSPDFGELGLDWMQCSEACGFPLWSGAVQAAEIT